MTDKTIEYKKIGRTVYLYFNRPEVLNALNEDVIFEMDNAISKIEDDADAGVLILTGRGKAFVSGADIKMLNKGIENPYEFFLIHDKLTRFIFRLERLRIPVIAAINGLALGGGCEIACGCDIRIAAESARLGLPEVGLGIVSGAGATARLPRLVGKGQAMQMQLTGDPITAQEAHRIGLVNMVVPDGEAVSAAEKMADRILKNGPAAVFLIKRAIQIGTDMPLEGAMEYCQYAAWMAAGTHDAIEGTRAFIEKRKPVWQGK
jgi:enoyl-CoA hydratase